MHQMMQALIGKVVVAVQPTIRHDAGYVLVFDDGTKMEFGYSACEGIVHVTPPGGIATEIDEY